MLIQQNIQFLLHTSSLAHSTSTDHLLGDGKPIHLIWSAPSSITFIQGAVARGDLTQKIVGVRVSGEILQLVTTINSMIDDLDSFARGVMRVAKEVGTDGKLGGQADTDKLVGTWLDITYAPSIFLRVTWLLIIYLQGHL